MSPQLILAVIVIYFVLLLSISYITGRNADSNAFFMANKQSPWYLVAFGMIGTSISGVTFISVPGAVGGAGFSYFQIVLGYIVGYFVIGTVLMPLYYRLNLVSIYTYLEQRFGFWAYKTGAAFFLLSRTIGSSLRLYLAAAVLQLFLFEQWGVPFGVTVAVTILLIWLYTFKGGIKTIVWTDSFQTFFLIASLGVSVYLISQQMGWSLGEMISQVSESKFSQMFFWDVKSDKYFFKQFIAGIFLAIVMTGLDQDLMQKNLTCRNIKEAQKNMFWFTITMVIVNILFLTLGALLYLYSINKGIAIPERTDDLYPILALNHFGLFAGLCFLLGIIASSYASADSALASLTTSFCIDFLDFKNKEEKQRQKEKFIVHVGFSIIFLLIIIVFKEVNSKSVISTVLKMASYTYGPLLGLFAFGILSKRTIADKYSPIVCVLAPLVTFYISEHSAEWFYGYKFSFETLILNGIICYFGLWLISKKMGSKEMESL